MTEWVFDGKFMNHTKINTNYLEGEDYKISVPENFSKMTLKERDEFALKFLKENGLKIRKTVLCVGRYSLGSFLPTSISVISTDYKNGLL